MADQKPTKEQIRQRLNVITASLTTTLTALFTNNVDEGLERYIVALIISGDGTASRTVDIAYGAERTATIFDNLPIAPTDIRQLPEKYDIENPIITLAGGENLRGSQSAGSGVTVTIIYWDSEPWSTNVL